MSRYLTRGLQIAVDLGVLSVALWLAFLIRFEFAIPGVWFTVLLIAWPLVLAVPFGEQALNPSLEIPGIVLTMHDARNNRSNQVVADVRQHMGSKVYDTVIPRNVRISEAPSYGKPVLVYDLKCVGSQAYLRLATEVIQRERELRATG